MKFIYTIDTEGDNQWDHGRDLTVDNIKYVPRFQELCEKYFVKTTYLVTSEVCDDSLAKKIFSDFVLRGTCEVGAHLHAWTTPPFLDKPGYRCNDANHSFATEFPLDLLQEKVKNLSTQIKLSFGKAPTSFRSGRYGFDENLARILTENSYLVDSSVTPYTSWSHQKGMPDGKGGPDFRDKVAFPYRYEFSEGSLYEVPITILPTKFPLNKYDSLAGLFFRNVDNNTILKAIRRLLFKNQPLWLRPLPWMEFGMYNEILNEAIRINLPYIVMMFHSSELKPGCSIYRPDNDSIERLYRQLEELFVLLNKKNIESITLTEAARD